MKIKLDTKEKIIEIEEKVNLGELFKMIQSILPNNLWKEYDINTQSVIYWTNPLYYPLFDGITTPVNPNFPWITYTNGAGDDSHIINSSIIEGVYCIEVKG